MQKALLIFILVVCSTGCAKLNHTKTPGGIRVDYPDRLLPSLVRIDDIYRKVCECAETSEACPKPPSVRIRKEIGPNYFWIRGDGLHVSGLYWPSIKRVEVLRSLSALAHEYGHHLSHQLGLYGSGVTEHSPESLETKCQSVK